MVGKFHELIAIHQIYQTSPPSKFWDILYFMHIFVTPTLYYCNNYYVGAQHN